MLVLGAFAAAGCEPAAPEGIDRDTFIAAYVDLRRAAVDGQLDSLVRDSILRAHDVTETELRGYIDERRDDPAAISDTWREIMDSIAPPDTGTESDDRVRPNR
jgi:hypothetical protein